MRSEYTPVTTRPPGGEVSQGSHASPQGKPSAEDLGTADINELAQQFSDVARSLQAHHDTNEMLAEVVTSAVRLIPGADEASISVVTRTTKRDLTIPLQ